MYFIRCFVLYEQNLGKNKWYTNVKFNERSILDMFLHLHQMYLFTIRSKNSKIKIWKLFITEAFCQAFCLEGIESHKTVVSISCNERPPKAKALHVCLMFLIAQKSSSSVSILEVKVQKLRNVKWSMWEDTTSQSGLWSKLAVTHINNAVSPHTVPRPSHLFNIFSAYTIMAMLAEWTWTCRVS